MSSSLSWLFNKSRLGLLAGLAGTCVLAAGTTASLGGFSASVQNTGDKAQSGSLIMQEQVTPSGGSTTTCLSTGSGSAISTNANAACGANKFGALTNAIPGAASYSTVIVQNQGSVAANSLSLTAGSCTATGTAPTGATATNVGSDTSGYCGLIDVTIEDDTGTAACVYPAGAGSCPSLSSTYNLTSLATWAASARSLTAPVAAGGSRTYKVSVQLDSTATNADQAMAATEPLTFTFGS